MTGPAAGAAAETAEPAEATVGMLGEAELLRRILPRLRSPAALLGPGDDAAVVVSPDGRTVISIDTLVQDQDFRLEWPNGYRSSGYDVGWKSAAQNLSDINAMGAVPTALVISLTLPPETAVAWAEGLADGLSAALAGLGAVRCTLAGGDLGRGRELSVTAAVTGDLEGRVPLLRSGARAGDILAVGGTLGRAAAGLALLEHGPALPALQPELLALVHAQARPEPPLRLGPQAAAAGATAMMDISDGLVRDAGRLAAASGVHIDLAGTVLGRFAALLAPAGTLLRNDPLRWVLGGGEDHGLLVAFPPAAVLPDGFTAVGEVSSGAPAVTVDGREPAVLGWDHFGAR